MPNMTDDNPTEIPLEPTTTEESIDYISEAEEEVTTERNRNENKFNRRNQRQRQRQQQNQFPFGILNSIFRG